MTRVKKSMKSIFVILILLMVTNVTMGWWRSSRANSCDGKSYPYWFGETDRSCVMRRGKRSVQQRNIFKQTHRWIEYRGHFFEFLGQGNARFSVGSPVASEHCRTTRERRVAGHGTLSLDCLRRCTRNYENTFGTYNLTYNNCNVFANRFSDILCKEISCPDWCN